MKKQFLHEQHNLQDRAKKPDYQERIRDEGDNFDRGGVKHKRMVTIHRSSVSIDLSSILQHEKQSLLRTLDTLRFTVKGEIGTIRHLMKNPKLAKLVKERYDLTRLSVLRTTTIVDCVQHPKKQSWFRIVEFECFLQPLEPFHNPIFKEVFAFRLNVPRPRVRCASD